MICPHCQQEMPDDHGAAFCPLCGKGLSAATPVELPLIKIKAVWIFTALLLPPLLTMLSAYFMNQSTLGASDNENVSPMVGLIGGAIGGLACGIMLGLRIGKTAGARVVLSIVFAAIMIVVCVMLCLVGCTFGGYRLSLH